MTRDEKNGKRIATVVLMMVLWCGTVMASETDNDFHVSPVGDRSKYVLLNQTVELAVNATCLNGDLHYQWYKENSYEGIQLESDRSTCTTDPVTAQTRYWCEVTDDYSHKSIVYFNINVDNQLVARADGVKTFSITPNESVTFAVTASCAHGNLYYRWNSWDIDVSEEITGNTYTTNSIDKRCSLSCTVSDDYGNRSTVYFVVTVNHLTVNGNSMNDYSSSIDYDYYVNPYEDFSGTFEVEATCDKGSLTYSWTCFSDETVLSTDSSLAVSIQNITEEQTYRCIIEDEYGNDCYIYYNIHISSGLAMKALSESAIKVKPGENAELSVAAVVNAGNIRYQWYYNELLNDYGEPEVSAKIQEATNPMLTTMPILRSTQYICKAWDDFGHSAEVVFSVEVDSGLFVTGQYETDVSVVHPGDTVVMTVEPRVDIGSLNTYWEMYDGINGYQKFTDKGYTFTIDHIETYTEVYFRALDDYGNEYQYWFKTSIDNELSAAAKGDTLITVHEGDQITLEVDASAKTGPLKYRWHTMKNEGNSFTEPVYTVYIEKEEFCSEILCDITDVYGSMVTVSFTLVWEEIQEIIPDQVYGFDSPTVFRFTPSVSGVYELSTDSLRAYLKDSDGQIISNGYSGYYELYFGEDGNETHYCKAYVSGTLDSGNTYYFVVEAGEPWLAHAKLTKITTEAVLESESSILNLPLSLKRIESEAFDVSSADAIRIPASVEFIASDAFSGHEFFIITSEGSYAEIWAVAHEINVLID